MKRILLAMLLMLFVTASAYAAQKDVEVSTTRPQIVEGTCSQAGSLGFTFRDDTVFTENSTITVNFTPANVELCESIDMYWNSTTTAGFNNDNAVVHVKGNPGDNFFTITNLKDTVQASIPSAKVTFFDGTKSSVLFDGTYVTWNGTELVWAKNFKDENGVDQDKDKPIDPAVAMALVSKSLNSLCVDAPSGTFNVVVNMDSKNSTGETELTFTGDDIIAIPGKSNDISLQRLKDTLTAELPAAGDQGAKAGCIVDYETGNGTCEDPRLENAHITLVTGSKFPTGEYSVELTMLVNGASGDHGAYFGGFAGAKFYKDLQSIIGEAGVGDVLTGGKGKYFLANGDEADGPYNNDCAPDKEFKAVKIFSTDEIIAADVNGQKYLRINVPTIAIPGLSVGDTVSVAVTVRQGRCNVLLSETVELFTIVDECAEDAGATAGKLIFPYFAGSASGYWNGLAIVNTGTSDVAASIEIYEVNGNKGTVSVTVPAEGMFVDLVENLPALAGFTPNAANAGTMGAERSYIKVTGVGLQGFAMMGDGTQSMGYIVP